MNKKKISLLALGMLIVGAGASIAYQSHAAQVDQPQTVQAKPVVSTSGQTDLTIDQKDANDKDIETNDDATVIRTEKDSANDSDSDAQSEQNEVHSDQAEVGD